MSETKKVAVIGSLNIDYFTRVETLPSPGETVASSRLELFHGGKGANQAISACRQEAHVYLFGMLGSDEQGNIYRNELEAEGIDVTYLQEAGNQSGAAFITVDHKGENMIVTAAGANARLSVEDIRKGTKAIESCGAILGQFEVPHPPLVEAARIANRAEIPVVINPSPFSSVFPWQEIRTDFLIVNEIEAGEVLEFRPEEEENSMIRQRLHELRIETLIVTRGGDDTLVYSRTEEPFSVPTIPVLPIDTVGAGDAFAGCFAARLAFGDSLRDAIQAANCAGALTTLGPGAQSPIPDRAKVDQHVEYLSQES
ncbi:MAG: ribokinase [Verrucomicrobiales bacterium]|nr:ribokinase [Verrucomicrobiales bacterium]